MYSSSVYSVTCLSVLFHSKKLLHRHKQKSGIELAESAPAISSDAPSTLFSFSISFILFLLLFDQRTVKTYKFNSKIQLYDVKWKETIRILNFDSVGKVTRLNLLGLKKIKSEDQNKFSSTIPMPSHRFLDIRNERMKTRQRNKETNQQVNIDWPSF